MKKIYTICILVCIINLFHNTSYCNNPFQPKNQAKTSLPTTEAPFSLVKLYPNPVKDNLTIELMLKEKGTVRCIVFDILGNSVSKEELHIEYNGTTRITLDLSKLHSGIYILKTEKEGKAVSFRFKKQ